MDHAWVWEQIKSQLVSPDSFLISSHLCWTLPLLHQNRRNFEGVWVSFWEIFGLFGRLTLSLLLAIFVFHLCPFSSHSATLSRRPTHLSICLFSFMSFSENLFFKFIPLFHCRWWFVFPTPSVQYGFSEKHSSNSSPCNVFWSGKGISELLISFMYIRIFFLRLVIRMKLSQPFFQVSPPSKLLPLLMRHL